MEYSVRKLAKMSGVSPRTLRYYDEINLLKPARIEASGYRYYGQRQIDQLQQILLYRELGFPLMEIGRLMSADGFDREQAFLCHLRSLQSKRDQLDVLIANVTRSLQTMKGESNMTDSQKFEGFKQALIDENEQKYGQEVRERFGDGEMDRANNRLKGLTQQQYDEGERLRLLFEQTLKDAFEMGDPAGEQAQKACDYHRQWLSVFYPAYSREYHKGLADMYVADERFQANYEKIADGCTLFLRDAIYAYCGI